MLLGLTYQLVLFIVDLVLVRTRSDAQLRAEVLALRHQLRVLERRVDNPAWQPGDRILLACLSRVLPRSGLSSLLPRPETLLRWHRDLEAVIKEFLVHYHQARPHQGLEQRCPEPLVLARVRLPISRQLVRHHRQGRLLHEYSWAA